MRTVALAMEPKFMWMDVMRGVIARGHEYGWRMISLNDWQMTAPASVGIDGMISSLSGVDHILAKKLHETYPVSVSVGDAHVQEWVPRVKRDEALLGEQAAAYFLERGYRNLAVAGYEVSVEGNMRLATFRAYVQRKGATCHEFIPVGTGHKDNLEYEGRDFRRKLKSLKLPLAIFCMNDRLAARVCHWCMEEGLSVPEQVSVLGVGNKILSCESNLVPISSIDYGEEHRGAEAANLLQRMMDGCPAEGDVYVPPGEVVTRRSTDIVAIQDLPTAHALRYVWDHYRENLSVGDVSKAIGVSERTLVRHFSTSVGHGIGKELCLVRLRKACEMLSTTEIPSEDIAALTGFRSAQYFTRRFKREYGLSPQRFRQRARISHTGRTTDGVGVPLSG